MSTTARDRIEEVLDSIRPALRSDGGDVEFIDYDEDDGIVQLRLVGACGSCPGIDGTVARVPTLTNTSGATSVRSPTAT